MKSFKEPAATDKTPSARDAERSYRQALKLERDRERQRRRYRKGAFASSMLHIEHDADFQRIENSDEDPRNAWISDNGAGAEEIRSFDEDVGGSYYTRALGRARKRLERHAPELMEVFSLIVRNVNNRRESIASLASRHRLDDKPASDLYFGHRKKISLFFKAQ